MSELSGKSSWQFKYWVFPAYLRAFRARKKPRKRRPTERGQLIITGAVLTAALGLNTETSSVYQLFALLLCLAIASRIGLRISKPNVNVKRILPRYATAGQQFTYRIRIENLSDRTESDLTVTDIPNNKLPTLKQYQNEREPDEDFRNAYDRFIGFHRFIYLQRQNTGIQTTPTHVTEVSRQSYEDADIQATALRRGRVEFSHSVVLHQDPLSLNYGFNHFDNPETMLVLPERFQLSPNLQLSGGRSFQQGGLTSAWSTGESDEFVSLRDYRDGDAMKKIHWPSSAKQTARKQNLVVKEYQDEFFARNALILDICDGKHDQVEKAISIAASFVMEQQVDNILDLIFLSQDQAKIITADLSNQSGHKQLEALAMMQPDSTEFSALTEASLTHLKKVSGCVCIFSSWQKQHEEFVRRITTLGKELRCLVVADEVNTGKNQRSFTLIRPSHAEQDLLSL